MTIADTLVLTRIRLAAKTDAELGLFEPDKQIERLVASQGRVDPAARDHDRALTQQSLPGIKTELEEDVMRVDEALSGRSSRGANLAIAVIATVESIGWFTVAGSLDLSGLTRGVVAVGLAAIFVQFSRHMTRRDRPATPSEGKSRRPTLMARLQALGRAVATRIVYGAVVLCVVALKVADAVEDGEPTIRVIPQALLLAVACVGPALLIESILKRTAGDRELESKRRGLRKRLRAEHARIDPAKREIARRHRQVAREDALIPRLRSAYQLEHARACARLKAAEES